MPRTRFFLLCRNTLRLFYNVGGTRSYSLIRKVGSLHAMLSATQPDYTTWTSEQLVQRVLELERHLREQVNQFVYHVIHLLI